MHPQVIGRGSRLAMLDGLVEHMKARPGVRFERVCDYVERRRPENPLAEWKARDPVHAGLTDTAGP